MKPLYGLTALIGFAGFAAAQAPTVGGKCPVFPADNIWNARVDQLPVHPSSSTWVTTIGTSKPMHPDFGSGLYQGEPIGIPFITVPGTQTKYPVTFQYASESDPGPYAIPLDAPIEGGSSSTGDRHTIAVDTDNCILYELYAAYPQTSSWQAGSGVIFTLTSEALRTAGWTSADAAGLPIFPGLVRYDEIAAGAINHAIRFTVPQTQDTYVWPGRHEASSLTGSQYPPMGARFRLKSSFDISTFSPTNQIILKALQRYGMMLADNGSSWYISGAPDARWDNNDLHNLGTILGSNFEAVDVSPLMVDPNTGQAITVTVTPPTSAVPVNKKLQFTATVTPIANQAVTWDVNGVVGGNATVGFIDSVSGLYTAPAVIPSPATVNVHATSKAVSAAVGSVTVLVGRVPTKVGIFRSSGFMVAEDVDGNIAWDPGIDRAIFFGVSGDIIIHGDWDGSGTTKLGIYRPGAAMFALDMNGNGVWDPGIDRFGFFGTVGDVPLVGDWTGDGKSKIGIFRPTTNLFALDINNDLAYEAGTDKIGHFGVSGDLPIVGDWTGDGISKIGIYRPSVSLFAEDANNNLTWDSGIDKSGVFGVPGDQAIIGDWTGDGIAKIGIYRSSTSLWGLDIDNNLAWDPGTDKAGVFGAPGDLCEVGDWDGTGVARAGIFRPSSGLWGLDKNGNLAWDAGIDLSGVFGAAGDTPIVGRW
ncbi:MAG TPA: Ig-like domain-containing protein [Bryobacteraceae bacterium]|nr:Ig-like domain-containing protein [Bryobacteraceae bacterium]